MIFIRLSPLLAPLALSIAAAMPTAHHAGMRCRSPSRQPALITLGLILAVYLVALGLGLPQAGTRMVVEGGHPESADRADAAPHLGDASPSPPPPWTVAPLVVLLGAVALLPALSLTEPWWESNRNRLALAAALAAATLTYYLLWHEAPVATHWPAHSLVAYNPDGLNLHLAGAVLADAMLGEYVPFIVLLFALFTISGGVRIEGGLAARPATNATIIGVGGLLASFIGTTGAAMLLIRPLLNTNRRRRGVRHTVVFFIFVVCNCGGCLLPIGDPPLFLGYLGGVPFWWTLNLWPAWLFVNAALVTIYYLWDRFWAWPREAAAAQRSDQPGGGLRLRGLWLNAPLLAGVVLAVALLDPSKALPGTDWHAWLYLREAVQLGLVAVSLLLGSAQLRRQNAFSYQAIGEVAALFLGIFVCMQPALQILAVRGPELGLDKPWQYFWATGILSGVLDNAPTYVIFFETAEALSAARGETPAVAGVAEPLLVAVSLGAVFLGAMTYIGNGPNFMVKAIAETSGVEMPGFLGYLLYSGAVLLPLLVITAALFL